MPPQAFRDFDPHFVPTEAAPLEACGDTPSSLPAEPARVEPAGTLATFMYARLRNFAPACQRVEGSELTAFVNEVRHMLSSASLKLGGEIAQRRPDSILSVFPHAPGERLPAGARRGLYAAMLTVHECVKLADRLAQRPRTADIPLSIAVGVHLGVGEVTPRATSNSAERMVHATGEAVEITRLLEMVAADLNWTVATSFPTRQAAGVRMAPGRSGTLALPDDSFLEVVELGGLVSRVGSSTPQSHYDNLRQSLLRNQQLAKAAGIRANAAGHVLIEDYRLLRKIGQGGIASIYLAQPIAGGAPQVLKVLRLEQGASDMDVQRFIQEYALLAQVDHPNVARIFRQDFCAGSAYIAMEYFPLGDLRSRMHKALDPAIALYYLKQIAAGLDAIHRVGIVHRDLKPDNVMVRQDGILALADFGIAKQVSMQITDTGADEVVGTPYYLSPEQALGRQVDARSDIYSLGALAYEMLTGRKAYYADTVEELLSLHANAPVPSLPAAYRHLQPVLDRMMAKNPGQRYADALQLLDALTEAGA